MQVVGADWAARQWACVVLEDSVVAEVTGRKTFAEVVNDFHSADAIGVDIPIGLPIDGPYRRADREARQLVSASTVFQTYPQVVYEAGTHADAVVVCRANDWPGISRQSFGLWQRISEVAPFEDQVREVHPEVSFQQMNGAPLGASKHSWNGFFLRRRLLANHGLHIPDQLTEPLPLIDVLDAAAVAWTAQRVANRAAATLPADPRSGEPTITY